MRRAVKISGCVWNKAMMTDLHVRDVFRSSRSVNTVTQALSLISVSRFHAAANILSMETSQASDTFLALR